MTLPRRSPTLVLTSLLALASAACTPDTTVALDSSDDSDTDGSSSSTNTDTDTSTDSGTDTEDPTDDQTDPTDTGEDPAVCGDGLIEGDEQCDDGRYNGPGQHCNASCVTNVCGDADPGPGEACDDGNDVDDDACTSACALPTCGNGYLDPGEQCEDGNDDPADACTNTCLYAACGDGLLWAGHEECDDGNLVDHDGCNSACDLTVCGDGLVELGEDCEDGNEEANDGCFACQSQKTHAITLGTDHVCALLEGGAVRCWGTNAKGQLGYGHTETIGDDETPASAGDVELGGVAVQLAAGDRHTCALLDDGTVRCWGHNGSGQLGLGHTETIGDDELPTAAPVVDVGGTVTQIAAGGHATCAVLDTGKLRCWGYAGAYAYASLDNVGDDEHPAEAGDVSLLGPGIAQVAVGWNHACSLTTDGGVQCWGQAADGKLGYGNLVDIGGSPNKLPASAGWVSLGEYATHLSLGRQHSCALLESGGIRCWGRNVLSNVLVGDNELPSSVGVLFNQPALDVAAGDYHTCAILADHGPRCWGIAGTTPLGYPGLSTDVQVGGPVSAVAGSYLNSCAILQTGALRCWGSDASGMLGFGEDLGPIGDDEYPAEAPYVPVY